MNTYTYKQPEFEVIKFQVPDIITTSSTEHDNAYGDITDLLRRK